MAVRNSASGSQLTTGPEIKHHSSLVSHNMNEHRSGDTENTSEYTYISVSNISRSDQGARIKSSNKTLTRYSVFENKGNA